MKAEPINETLRAACEKMEEEVAMAMTAVKNATRGLIDVSLDVARAGRTVSQRPDVAHAAPRKEEHGELTAKFAALRNR